ncbi:hypothetical protein [Falsirhodobacter xinxiangensis]|uniref:hypothetical protein n=1 Tax=Falsirhodobacter xinxiangensis TaxID=2530049 RepID=UPI0010AB3C6F|nr:hypothetical protein [Rhodobacter xinxiangensis]
MRIYIALIALPLLASCAEISNPFRREQAPPPAAATALGAIAKTPEAYDLTSEAERERALAAPVNAGAERLGAVVAVLGNAGEPGFWMRSSLVKEPRKGRVETADGASVAVDLLPGAGSAQLSLAAYRALGLSLTALPQVTVYAD